MTATELNEAPNLAALYLKAVASTPTRRGGNELPDTEYVRRGITVDRDHLAEYNRVCGFGMRDELPPTYPHILSFGAAVRLMTDPGFPFPLVGLVHVANTITQRRPLLVTETLTQRVHLANLRPHPKGRQFDIVTETDADGETVWTESSTYLRRGKPDESAAKSERTATIEAGSPTATWRLPGDLGRRYAAVSGDRNPIHLHPLTAKAFGFPRAIAHGMWSKARCLAVFEGRLPETYTAEVSFAKPVLLPSTVEFTERDTGQDSSGRENHGQNRDFALHSRSGKPHLRGSVR
ncbi:MaoC dehydratase-like protein [Halopolyspora algeriensis]|uniref:MaoC dehydratase-like protein n=1 Tax=Halopolyspora algeriensis TaxID=1500506 RepID=A0A368VYV7_9ACTN|nr:MaoC/PaaZ C-terminal domain-containing protein [Halopolyspora algeriensis]RCW47187.1 MaoC dehydratase-like protein [Halopolyspora algeriensis]TQM48273.1 MaoC dehydratase-like protein [Halopolyspora algeriensis]